VDYDDTYAPVAKLALSQALIAIANCFGLELYQIDIKGAYLNGVLLKDKVLYMWHPPGYKSADARPHVLHLIKMLYGLKQLGHCWYQKLTSIFSSLSFAQCDVDQAIFYKSNKQSQELIAVTVHMDDYTIAATSIHLIKALKASLHQHIKVTNLRALHWMLDIKVK
jgi:Reverse transcriptase (RNA-dependent DNA polymerase)